MESTAKHPQTLRDAIVYFSDVARCEQYMKELRWPDGKVTCPNCGSRNVKWLPNAHVFKCFEKHARQKFSLKVGTIFEDSPIGLDKWLPAVWMVVNCKNGISSWELHRAVGLTQKSAWFALHRVRLALHENFTDSKLGGIVEVDETFIGGKARNMHASRRKQVLEGKGGGSSHLVPVQGFLERGGKMRAQVLQRRKMGEMVGNVKRHVEEGSTVMTDEARAYICLQAWYGHEVVNHMESYVRGNVHTNSLENFWSLLKRALGGTYVSVEPYHLFRYVDEQAFRFNNRARMRDPERFRYAMRQVVGKRLTYKQLTGKEGETGDMGREAGDSEEGA